jgi:hypothetical protein
MRQASVLLGSPGHHRLSPFQLSTLTPLGYAFTHNRYQEPHAHLISHWFCSWHDPRVCRLWYVQDPTTLGLGLSRVSAASFALRHPPLVPQKGFNSITVFQSGMIDVLVTQSEALELQARQSVLVTAPRALRHERIPSLRISAPTQSTNEKQQSYTALEHTVQ